jgi:predicted DNA-binding transcriptional regulator AlpA
MHTDATTTTKNRKRATVEIPEGFPHPHRLADMQLFAGVLRIAPSTFHRFMAEGRLPPAIKVGRCNRWKETDVARIAAEGITVKFGAS